MKREELIIGATILKPGSSAEYKTGSWRILEPRIDQRKCTKCGICWTFCPEGAIRVREDGSFEVDLNYCKGCGICSHECPVKAIAMVKVR